MASSSISSSVLRAECLARATSAVLAAMAALIVGLDEETETVLMIRKKATVTILDALWKTTIVSSAVGGYQLLQLLRCVAFAWLGRDPACQDEHTLAWFYFLLDQGATYIIFAATMAGLQGALVAVFGVHSLQWSKLCNIYTRYCVQIGAGLICALVGTLAMGVVAGISAYRLFRRCPPLPSKAASGRRRWLLC